MTTSWDQARWAVGWRAAQQAGVQAIYFARFLILARLLAPEAFGMLAIATVALTVLLSISDLGVIPALVQRGREDLDEHDAAWSVGLLRASAVALVLAAAAPGIARLFDEPRVTPVIQLLALKPLIEASGSIGVVRLIRALRFRELAAVHLSAAVIDTCVAVTLARSMGVWALVVGALCGATVSAMLSYVVAPHRPRLLLDFTRAVPLVSFGRWMLGISIVGLVATSGVQMLISRELGATALGLYFLATKLAFLPADAVGAVLGSVAFPLYASVQRDDRRTVAAFRSVLSAQAILLFPTYALILVLAPSLTQALGPAWSGTAPLIQIVGLAALVGTYADNALPLLTGRGRPDHAMLVVTAQTAALLLVLLPLLADRGAIGAALAWLPAYAAAFITSIVLMRRHISDPFGGGGIHLLLILLVAAAGGGVAAFTAAWLAGVAALLAGAAAGVFTTIFLLVLLSRRLDFGIEKLVSGRAVQAA